MNSIDYEHGETVEANIQPTLSVPKWETAQYWWDGETTGIVIVNVQGELKEVSLKNIRRVI